MCPRCCINCEISLNASKQGLVSYLSASKAAHPEVFPLCTIEGTRCGVKTPPASQWHHNKSPKVQQQLSLWVDREQEEKPELQFCLRKPWWKPFGYGFHLVGPEQQIFRQKLGNNKVMSSTCVFKAPFLSRGFEEGLTITAMPLNLSPSLQCCMPLSILLTVITVMSHTVSLPCLQPSCTSLLDVWTLNRGSQGPSPYGHCYSLAPHLSSSWSNFLRFLKGFVLFLVSRSSHALFLLPRTFFSRIPNPIPISKLQPIQNFLEGCMTQVFTPFPLGSAL